MQLRNSADNGPTVPPGCDADQVRRLPVCVHHAAGLLQDTASGRGEHTTARGERATSDGDGAARGAGGRPAGACCYQSEYHLPISSLRH